MAHTGPDMSLGWGHALLGGPRLAVIRLKALRNRLFPSRHVEKLQTVEVLRPSEGPGLRSLRAGGLGRLSTADQVASCARGIASGCGLRLRLAYNSKAARTVLWEVSQNPKERIPPRGSK